MRPRNNVGYINEARYDVFGERPLAHDQVRCSHRPGLVIPCQCLQTADIAPFEALYSSPLIPPAFPVAIPTLVIREWWKRFGVSR